MREMQSFCLIGAELKDGFDISGLGSINGSKFLMKILQFKALGIISHTQPGNESRKGKR